MKAPEIVLENKGVRIVARTVAELIKEGQEEGRYTGSKWGSLYLRAPDIFFRILEKAGNKLVRLGDIAEVRRGFTTGANDFFYLKPLELTVKEVAELRHKDPHAPVQVKNDTGWEGEIEAAWLRPVVKSSTEVKTLAIRLEDLQHLVFMPPDDVREAIQRGSRQPLQGYALAEAYIRWGEEQGYHRGSTLKSRPRWWDLGARSSKILMLRATSNMPCFYFSSVEILHDQTFYSVIPKAINSEQFMAAVFNSAISNWLFREVQSGASLMLGLGAVWTAVYEAKNILGLAFSAFTPSQRHHLLTAFERMSNRPVKSIFQELGFPLCHQRRCQHPEHPYEHVQPEALTLEQVQKASPDRFELDSVVFDVLDLTDEERLEVYRAVAQMVKERLVKARNRGNERQPRR